MPRATRATKQAATPAAPTEDISEAGLRAFCRIAELWDLPLDQQLVLLGGRPKSTFYNWKKNGGTLPEDVLERISYILGIYRALEILLPKPEAADDWVKKPNTAPTFGGRSALDRMLGGKVIDLYVVRQYLDAQRGGWA